jgi:hypothetical protein
MSGLIEAEENRVGAFLAPLNEVIPVVRPPDKNQRTLAGSERRRLGAAGLLVAAAAAVALALLQPWSGGAPDILGRALAAAPSGPVVHVVVTRAVPVSSAQRFELATGRPVPLVQSDELWYDRQRGTVHDITRLNGSVFTDILQTSKQTFTSSGEVTINGRTPPTTPPSANPMLLALAGDYRRLLASGTAHVTGHASIDGHPVVWIEFSTQPAGFTIRDAVDPRTGKTLYGESISRFGQRSPLLKVETLSGEPRSSADLTKPPVTEPFSEHASSEQTATLAEAKSALGQAPLLRGTTTPTAVTITNWQYSWAGGGNKPRVAIEVKLHYADGITIHETTSVLPLQSPGNVVAPNGFADFYAGALRFRQDGLYLLVESPTAGQALNVARTLGPLPTR